MRTKFKSKSKSISYLSGSIYYYFVLLSKGKHSNPITSNWLTFIIAHCTLHFALCIVQCSTVQCSALCYQITFLNIWIIYQFQLFYNYKFDSLNMIHHKHEWWFKIKNHKKIQILIVNKERWLCKVQNVRLSLALNWIFHFVLYFIIYYLIFWVVV